MDGLYFGVDVQKVQEVIRYQNMTRVSLAPREVRGLINLRGQIVTAVDLRRRLSLSERPRGPTPDERRCPQRRRVVSLLVDEIGDVLDVDEDTFEPPPETLDGIARELIRGAYKLEGRLLLELDTDRTIALNGETARSG